MIQVTRQRLNSAGFRKGKYIDRGDVEIYSCDASCSRAWDSTDGKCGKSLIR